MNVLGFNQAEICSQRYCRVTPALNAVGEVISTEKQREHILFFLIRFSCIVSFLL